MQRADAPESRPNQIVGKGIDEGVQRRPEHVVVEPIDKLMQCFVVAAAV